MIGAKRFRATGDVLEYIPVAARQVVEEHHRICEVVIHLRLVGRMLTGQFLQLGLKPLDADLVGSESLEEQGTG
jgi:riboflavin synthase